MNDFNKIWSGEAVHVDTEQARRICEWIRFATRKCRECRHGYSEHTCGGAWGCSCKEFVPPDNLDYIEWLAKKRGLV